MTAARVMRRITFAPVPAPRPSQDAHLAGGAVDEELGARREPVRCFGHAHHGRDTVLTGEDREVRQRAARGRHQSSERREHGGQTWIEGADDQDGAGRRCRPVGDGPRARPPPAPVPSEPSPLERTATTDPSTAMRNRSGSGAPPPPAIGGATMAAPARTARVSVARSVRAMSSGRGSRPAATCRAPSSQAARALSSWSQRMRRRSASRSAEGRSHRRGGVGDAATGREHQIGADGRGREGEHGRIRGDDLRVHRAGAAAVRQGTQCHGSCRRAAVRGQHPRQQLVAVRGPKAVAGALHQHQELLVVQGRERGHRREIGVEAGDHVVARLGSALRSRPTCQATRSRRTGGRGSSSATPRRRVRPPRGARGRPRRGRRRRPGQGSGPASAGSPSP
jgi:hypothetical protein